MCMDADCRGRGTGPDFPRSAIQGASIAERWNAVHVLPPIRDEHAYIQMPGVPPRNRPETGKQSGIPRANWDEESQWPRVRAVPYGPQWRGFHAGPLGTVTQAIRPQADGVSAGR